MWHVNVHMKNKNCYVVMYEEINNTNQNFNLRARVVGIVYQVFTDSFQSIERSNKNYIT
jgi:hypothetical protein